MRTENFAYIAMFVNTICIFHIYVCMNIQGCREKTGVREGF